jgi:hypothetical protein
MIWSFELCIGRGEAKLKAPEFGRSRLTGISMNSTESDIKIAGENSGIYERPKIVLIGGHTRNVRHLVERGRMAGWKMEQHSGVVKGRGTRELRAQVERADIVVITTRVNSHGGMFLAKDYARRFGRFVSIIRREKFAELENAVIRFQTSTFRSERN